MEKTYCNPIVLPDYPTLRAKSSPAPRPDWGRAGKKLLTEAEVIQEVGTDLPDVQLLYKVFGKEEDDRLEERKQQLKDEAVYIEDYQDITCYTKAGMTDDSYVVYVTYDVKFRRVDTLAPGLMWCYVVKNDNGDYIIRENVVGDEADYVANQNQTEDVRLLSTQVNERLKQAVESDSLLAGIYKDLSNGAVVSSSEEGADSQVMIGDGADASSDAGEGNADESSAAGETSAEESQEAQTEAPESAGESSDAAVAIQ